jgi:hypothetical protein
LLEIEILPLALPADVGENFAVKLTLCPGGIVCPAGDPPIVNPEPVALAPEIVTLADPVLERLTEADPLLPTTTLPKLTAEGVLANPGCVPAPVNAIDIGEFGASLETEILPLALPTDVGENFVMKLILCPGGILCPAGDPVIVNPAPVTLACEIITLADPVFVRLTDAVPLVPTPTFPKLTANGVLAKPGCVPVPASTIAMGEFGALLETEIFPLPFPTAVGENFAVKLMLCPA